MKVILFVSSRLDADPISDVIEKAGHHITTTITDPEYLIYLTAQKSPHALICEKGQCDALNNVSPSYHSTYPDVLIHFCDLQGDGWQEILIQFLRQPQALIKPRPYAQGPRIVYHAPQLLRVASPQPLRRANYETPDWQRKCAQQEGRFLMMLQAGLANHAAALRYYHCLKSQAHGLDLEIGYRLLHGSYKGYWARDVAARWIGLLCHYIPGAELDGLPPPMTPGPAIDYIGQQMSEEGLYATTLVLIRGVSPAMAREIRWLGASQFSQQPDDELLAECLRLYGFAHLLSKVGTALVRLMSQWLDASRPHKGDVAHADERHLGILRDFYDLPFILQVPRPLHDTLVGFHAGTIYVANCPQAPTFSEWRKIFTAESINLAKPNHEQGR